MSTYRGSRGDILANGSMGWHILHHSFDGREFTEPDHTGPAMPRER